MAGLFTLNACSKDYQPSDQDTGASMYQTACAQCHQKSSTGIIFNFEANNANVKHIKERIAQGNMRMPKFPHIQGEKLHQLSEYILNNSVIKK